MKSFYSKQKECSCCAGTGSLRHPHWDAYADFCMQKKSYTGFAPGAAAINLFWLSRDISPDMLPPKTIECWVCNGEGTWEEIVDIRDEVLALPEEEKLKLAIQIMDGRDKSQAVAA